MSTSSRKPRVLLVTLEFRQWFVAGRFSYACCYGLADGLDAAGADCFVLPAPCIHELGIDSPLSWLRHARQWFSGQQFDQVWFEICHSSIHPEILDWFCELAPVRLGFIFESRELAKDEWKNPTSANRRLENFERNSRVATHVVACDEADVAQFNREGKIPAYWWAGGYVPKRFIQDGWTTPQINQGLFFGTVYGDRQRWLEYPVLKGLLTHPKGSSEFETEFPAMFDRASKAAESLLASGSPLPLEVFDDYRALAKHAREGGFAAFLKMTGIGLAVVNLPQFGKAFSARIMDGMSAGRPVITYNMPDRPRTSQLFEPGKEILFYDPENPEQLAEHLRRLQREPNLAKTIAARARAKILSRHTSESLVEGILEWVGEPQEQPKGRKSAMNSAIQKAGTDLESIFAKGLWREGTPLRLHLGCGEQHFEGYVNIDYPPSEHTVMQVQADYFANVLELNFPAGSVDEIRLHHVFEHFSRVTALAMLIKWHGWLKPGGTLRIETPDLMGSARTLVSDATIKTKMGVVRHLAGDQAAGWAYHVDHWFPQRFEETLKAFGFEEVTCSSRSWAHEPFLSNVEAMARKTTSLTQVQLLEAADRLLWQSTVADAERPTWTVWRTQLHDLVAGRIAASGATNQTAQSRAGNKSDSRSSSLPEELEKLLARPSGHSLTEIHNFNQGERDRWMQGKANEIPAGSTVLDVGAGTCPYRHLFAHCNYKTHDFKKYTGPKLGHTSEYGEIDYVSEITRIPVPDGTFDVVVCTEVLEHVPEPIDALREMVRIVKPGGKLLITAPLGSGLHQLPFHFYGGYTPEWYRHFGKKFGLEVGEITPNGGFCRLLAQECARIGWTLPEHGDFHGAQAPLIAKLFTEWLPQYLFALEKHWKMEQFTVGYHVEFCKATATGTPLKPTKAMSEKSAPPNGPMVDLVVFSKDRPMQLDATLRSFALQCQDTELAAITVIYRASDARHQRHYETLMRAHHGVAFVAETDFQKDLLNTMSRPWVLFSVDDNIFIRPFHLAEGVGALKARPEALGVSYRLGRNTTYCYSLNQPQRMPQFSANPSGLLAFDWTSSQHDFAYPLEVSSSLYRTETILSILKASPFKNPNTLEGVLAAHAPMFAASHPCLFCHAQSAAFCVPINKVQQINDNRAGSDPKYSADELSRHFEEGHRIDVKSYAGIVPNACHQEVDLSFERAVGAGDISQVADAERLLREALEIDPKSVQPLKFLAAMCLQQKRWKEAGEFAYRAVEAAPKDVEALILLGNTFYHANDLQTAHAVFQRVLEIDPGHAIATDNLQLIASKMDSSDEPETRDRLGRSMNLGGPLPREDFKSTVAAFGRFLEDPTTFIESSVNELSPAFFAFFQLNVERLRELGQADEAAKYEKVMLQMFELLSRGKATPARSKPSLVTVIMPCYKHAGYLPEAVESLLAQTYPHWELIVVNDSSPDQTAEVTRALMAKYPERGIYLMTRPNGGLADCRNAGIRAAMGDYVLPLDADDKIAPTYLEETVRVLDAQAQVGVAYTDLQCFGDSNEIIPKGVFGPNLLQEDRIPVCSLFRRSMWEKVGGYNINMSVGNEDWDFWLGALERGYKGVRIPKVLFFYRVKAQSMWTESLKYYNQLFAQMVLNHPALYGKEHGTHAAALLASNPLPPPMAKFSTPRISVVIASYNHGHCLRETFDSVAAQTYGDWELVIVSDGSSDNTAAVVEQIRRDCPSKYILFLEQKNAGPAAARNRGIRAARGEYIYVLDSDDRIAPSMLEKTEQILASRPDVGFVYTHLQHFGAADTVYAYPDFDPTRLLHENIVCGNGLVRKSMLQQIGGYDESLPGYEDWNLWICAVGKGWKGHCIHEPLFEYRIAANSRNAEAFKRYEFLTANIILKHRKLYTAEKVRWAESMVGKRAEDRTAQRSVPTSPEDRMAQRSVPTSPEERTSQRSVPTLRITYLITSILGVTGGNQTLLRQANALHERGHKVTIVTCTPKPAWFQFSMPVIQTTPGEPMSKFVPPSDVVIATYFLNAVELLAIDAATKVYYAQGDQFVFDDADVARQPEQQQMFEISRASYLLPDIRFVPNSHNLASTVEKKYGRRADAILPVCTDQTIFRPLEKSLPGSRLRILIVGPDSMGSEREPLRFKGIKDIHDALQIVATRFPHFTAVRMSGTGPEIFARSPCEFYIAPNDEMKTFLFGTAHILIYASHYDSCPRPPQEAMAAGVAVVCTATDGAKEYCRDGENCLLVPHGDAGAIAAATERLLRDPELRNKLIKGGLETAAQWPREREWNELEALLVRFAAEGAQESAAKGVARTGLPAPAPVRKVVAVNLPAAGWVGHLKDSDALFDKKDFAGAWRATIEAIRLRPYHPEAYFTLARIAFAAGDMKMARACAQKARDMAPKWNEPKKLLKHLKTSSGKQQTWPEIPAAPKLTVCLIAKNEERFLGQCLASIRTIADQIIVVDTGSTDRTIEIAKGHGAEIYEMAWDDDFSAPRNLGLEHARGEWILVLDADEELRADQHALLRKDCESATALGFRLPLVNVSLENQGVCYVPRLFRNAPGIFYLGRIHEQVFSSVSVRATEWGLETAMGETTLHHYGYTETMVRDRNKVERNLKLLQKAVIEFPDEPGLLMNLGLEITRSGRPEEGLQYYAQSLKLFYDGRSPIVPEFVEQLLTQYSKHLLILNRFQPIIDIFEKQLPKGVPMVASHHYVKGLAHMKFNQYDLAVKEFEACLKKRHKRNLSPINTDVLTGSPAHSMAIALNGLKRPEAAEKAFLMALDDSPNERNLCYDHALFLHQQKRPLEAIQRLHALITRDPKDLPAWILGAHVALAGSDFLEFALDWTEQALVHHPADLVLHQLRGEALLFSGRAAESQSHWQKAGRNARVMACGIMTGLLNGVPAAELVVTDEIAVNREFMALFRQMISFGAETAIRQLAAKVGQIKRLLPVAGGLIEKALAETNADSHR